MSSSDEAELHPQDGERGPTVYEEAHDMLSYASMMYLVSELRAMAREGELQNCDTILSLPLTLGEVEKIYEEHGELLNELHGENRHNRHGRVLKTMMSKKSIDPEQPDGTRFVVFADHDADELVYSIAVDYSTRNVVVAFRGTVTSTDITADIKALHKKVPNPLRTRIPNPLDAEITNPLSTNISNSVSAEKIDTAQAKCMKLHNGFHGYLFQQDTPEEKSKFDVILEQAISILREHMGFGLYVTGHSLGGALCTLFSFYAALDPFFVDPVICYSFASPKLGTISFRKAFQVSCEGRHRSSNQYTC
ncbi:lipase [Gracilaria domingensis]|nr:lipase [Gracilaria domingensis]